MTNALVFVGNAQIDPVKAAIQEELARASDTFALKPMRIKLPSGGNPFFNAGDEPIKEIRAVILWEQSIRGLYLTKKVAKGMLPLCSSPDNRQGFFNWRSEQVKDAMNLAFAHPALKHLEETKEELDGPWDCHTCPLGDAAWRRDEVPPCHPRNKMLIWVEGWGAPAFLTLSRTSLGNLREYASNQRTIGSAYFAVWTKLCLAKDVNAQGQEFYRVTFEADGDIGDALMSEVIAARQQLESLARQAGVQSDDYEDLSGNGDTPPPTEDIEMEAPF